MTDRSELSFKDQVRALLDENIDKYPDAVEWMVNLASQENLAARETRYEKFIKKLEGNDLFDGHPFDPDNRKGNDRANSTLIPLIKWYREKHGCGLKEAKYDCEEFIYHTYPDCDKAKQLAQSKHWKPRGVYHVSGMRSN